MFCAKCGTQMEDNAAFCPNCGAKNEELAVEQTSQQTEQQGEMPAAQTDVFGGEVLTPQPNPIAKVVACVIAVIAVLLVFGAIFKDPFVKKVDTYLKLYDKKDAEACEKIIKKNINKKEDDEMNSILGVLYAYDYKFAGQKDLMGEIYVYGKSDEIAAVALSVGYDHEHDEGDEDKTEKKLEKYYKKLYRHFRVKYGKPTDEYEDEIDNSSADELEVWKYKKDRVVVLSYDDDKIQVGMISEDMLDDVF